MLEGMLLKPTMFEPGLECAMQGTVREVAYAIIISLIRFVPAAVSGIAFLSVGKDAVVAIQHLNAMPVRFKDKLPWAVAFTFAWGGSSLLWKFGKEK
ncbi:hypothetical protein A0256_00585 [Mucilaginibacter sp. PAMC 26640]|nr:hypothetical protein A0256_00585 [Mucilaginibacter sp. PAMC 26640]